MAQASVQNGTYNLGYFAVARYDGGGNLDANFQAANSTPPDRNGNTQDDSFSPVPGAVLTFVGPENDQANAVVVQPDGKVVLAGSSQQDLDSGAVRQEFAVVRYTADGHQDFGFGLDGSGTTTTQFGGFDASANAAALAPDGTIVVAGVVTGQGTSGLALARYRGGDLPPVAVDDQSVTPAGTPVTIPVTDNDFHRGEPITVTGISFTDPGSGQTQTAAAGEALRTAHGTAVLNADGTVTYTPDPGFVSIRRTPAGDVRVGDDDGFQYTISNGAGTSTAHVTVTVFDPDGQLTDLGTALTSGARGDTHPAQVTDVGWVTVSSPTAAGVYQGPVADPSNPAGFTSGSFALLTTGDVGVAHDSRDAGVDNHTRQRRAEADSSLANDPFGNDPYDLSVLHLGIDVPAGDNFLSFDFAFLSNEYPGFTGGDTAFRDGFIAELVDPTAVAAPQSTWVVRPGPNGPTVDAPANIAFDPLDPSHGPITTASSFFDPQRVQTVTGTLYNGGTPLLVAHAPVVGGRHYDLYLSVYDAGDGQIDSAVLVHGLATSHVDDPQAGVTQPPIAANDWVPVGSGRTVIPASVLLRNDLDLSRGASLAVVGMTQPAGGVAVPTFDGDGHITSILYTPTAAGPDQFTYQVSDGQGGTGTATVFLLPQVTGADSNSAAPGQNTQVQTGAVEAKLTKTTTGSSPTSVTVASYAGNPIDLAPPGGGNNNYLDVQAPYTDASDHIVLRVPGDPSRPLYYFDPVQNSWQPVLNSNGLPPPFVDGSFLVEFGPTSHPRVTGTHGTVFSVGVPVQAPAPATITPASVDATLAAPLNGLNGGAARFIGASRTTTFVSTSQVNVSLSASQDSGGTNPGPDTGPSLEAGQGEIADALGSLWLQDDAGDLSNTPDDSKPAPPQDKQPNGGKETSAPSEGRGGPAGTEAREEKTSGGRGEVRATRPRGDRQFLSASAVDAFFAAEVPETIRDAPDGVAWWAAVAALAGDGDEGEPNVF